MAMGRGRGPQVLGRSGAQACGDRRAGRPGASSGRTRAPVRQSRDDGRRRRDEGYPDPGDAWRRAARLAAPEPAL